MESTEIETRVKACEMKIAEIETRVKALSLIAMIRSGFDSESAVLFTARNGTELTTLHKVLGVLYDGDDVEMTVPNGSSRSRVSSYWNRTIGSTTRLWSGARKFLFTFLTGIVASAGAYDNPLV